MEILRPFSHVLFLSCMRLLMGTQTRTRDSALGRGDRVCCRGLELNLRAWGERAGYPGWGRAFGSLPQTNEKARREGRA